MSGTAAKADGRIAGRCLCGAVRITVDGSHDATVGACHCTMCRRWSGGAFLVFDAAAKAVTVEGEVATYASSDFAERAFCPVCGSHLWFRDVDAPGKDYELMPGLFEAAGDFPLTSEVYVDLAPAYARITGATRRLTRAEYEADNAFVEGDG